MKLLCQSLHLHVQNICQSQAYCIQVGIYICSECARNGAGGNERAAIITKLCRCCRRCSNATPPALATALCSYSPGTLVVRGMEVTLSMLVGSFVQNKTLILIRNTLKLAMAAGGLLFVEAWRRYKILLYQRTN